MSDGVLLRRDIHSLYDNGLLNFSEDGTVSVEPRVKTHYAEFDGVQVQATQRANFT